MNVRLKDSYEFMKHRTIARGAEQGQTRSHILFGINKGCDMFPNRNWEEQSRKRRRIKSRFLFVYHNVVYLKKWRARPSPRRQSCPTLARTGRSGTVGSRSQAAPANFWPDEAAQHQHFRRATLGFAPPRPVTHHTITWAAWADENSITSGLTSRAKSAYVILMSS